MNSIIDFLTCEKCGCETLREKFEEIKPDDELFDEMFLLVVCPECSQVIEVQHA